MRACICANSAYDMLSMLLGLAISISVFEIAHCENF
jgi:hypothetical protein